MSYFSYTYTNTHIIYKHIHMYIYVYTVSYTHIYKCTDECVCVCVWCFGPEIMPQPKIFIWWRICRPRICCFSFFFFAVGYIYIYIYVCVCVCVCVCVNFFSFFAGSKREKVNISKWIGPLRELWGGVLMVKAMDCRIIGSEFVLQSRCYVHFRTNTLGKGMNPLILPAMD